MSKPQRACPHAGQGDRAHFLVGQDIREQWLVVETHNRVGGLFKTKQDALHFAAFEAGPDPDAVEQATGPLRLTF